MFRSNQYDILTARRADCVRNLSSCIETTTVCHQITREKNKLMAANGKSIVNVIPRGSRTSDGRLARLGENRKLRFRSKSKYGPNYALIVSFSDDFARILIRQNRFKRSAFSGIERNSTSDTRTGIACVLRTPYKRFLYDFRKRLASNRRIALVAAVHPRLR